MATQETIASLGDTPSILNNLNGRIRLLEERFIQSRENLELLNENLVEGQKEVLKKAKNLDNEIKKIKNENIELTNTINHIIKEVSLFARKDSVKVLEKYINMWDPLKFTTEEDVKNLIKEETKKSEEESKTRGVESAE